MNVRYTREAQQQILDILLWLQARNPAAADALAERITQLAAHLEHVPYLGQIRHPLGVRELPVGRFPYLIYYLVGNDEVSILSVRHTSRRPPRKTELR